MFGDGRWEDQAESETAGAWGVMQRKEEYEAGTQIPPGLPGAGDYEQWSTEETDVRSGTGLPS